MIAIISPAFPWKGGISHHTNNLVNYLIEAGQKISLYTFSKQYPKFLYPGKEQQEPPGSANPLKIGAFMILNPMNPFTWWRTAHKIICEKPTQCLFQYWHPFFVPCFTIICWLLRKHDIKVICIVQTLIPHDRHYADSWLIRILFSQIDGAVLDKSMYGQFKMLFPHLPFKLIQLPVFNQFGDPVETTIARKHLGLPPDKKILLFFGFIRKYKGLDILLNSLPNILKFYPNVHLVVAGECFGDHNQYESIINKYHLKNNVTSHIKYIPNEEVRYWFGACDLLVMPYRHIINSGIENIGKIYAKQSLLTLGTTPEDLSQKIMDILKGKKQCQQVLFGWHEYVANLINFLNTNKNT